jgi:hypothetical protein
MAENQDQTEITDQTEPELTPEQVQKMVEEDQVKLLYKSYEAYAAELKKDSDKPLPTLEELKKEAEKENKPFHEIVDRKIKDLVAPEAQNDELQQPQPTQESNQDSEPIFRPSGPVSGFGPSGVPTWQDQEDSQIETEYNKQQELVKQLQGLKEQQENEIGKIEVLLNQLFKPAPNATPEVKEQYDKRIQELVEMYDGLSQKHQEVTKSLDKFSGNLKNAEQLLKDKNKTDKADTQKTNELQSKLLEFKADTFDSNPFEVTTSVTQPPQNEFEKTKYDETISFIKEYNPEITGTMIPKFVLQEKKEKFKESIKDTKPKTAKPPEPPKPSPVPTPQQPLPTPTPQNNPVPPPGSPTPTLTPSQTPALDDQVPSATLLKEPEEDTPQTKLEPISTSKLDNKIDFNLTNQQPQPPTEKLSFNGLESPFIPTPELPNEEVYEPSVNAENEKLDQVLAVTGDTKTILVEIAKMLPMLAAGNAMPMPSQNSGQSGMQIPMTAKSTKNTIQPSKPNIPHKRVEMGIA